jgi:hypothetical protein
MVFFLISRDEKDSYSRPFFFQEGEKLQTEAVYDHPLSEAAYNPPPPFVSARENTAGVESVSSSHRRWAIAARFFFFFASRFSHSKFIDKDSMEWPSRS